MFLHILKVAMFLNILKCHGKFPKFLNIYKIMACILTP